MGFRVAVLLAVVALLVETPASSSAAVPPTKADAPISIAYGKRVIRRYINRTYEVVRGPYLSACRKLAANKVRCDARFKAGLFWRCGRVSVLDSGGYDYISARLPIGC